MTMTKDIMKRHIGLFGVLAALAIAPMAHANYEIAFQVAGGAFTPCLNNPDSTNTTTNASGNPLTGGTVACSASGPGGIGVNFTGTSDSPGSPGLADEFSSVGSITNNSGSTQTVTIWYLAQGFTQPTTGGGVTGVNYASSLSGTGVRITGAGASNGLESCVDMGAGGTGTSFCLNPFSASSDLHNVTQTYPTGLGTSVSNSVSSTFAPLTAPYSLEQKITIVLEAGDIANFSDSQALTPVPEPVSVALLGGVLLLTGRAIQRKRKKQGAAV
jgi:hypothetical protein